jgi:hypothetical protein
MSQSGVPPPFRRLSMKGGPASIPVIDETTTTPSSASSNGSMTCWAAWKK